MFKICQLNSPTLLWSINKYAEKYSLPILFPVGGFNPFHWKHMISVKQSAYLSYILAYQLDINCLEPKQEFRGVFCCSQTFCKPASSTKAIPTFNFEPQNPSDIGGGGSTAARWSARRASKRRSNVIHFCSTAKLNASWNWTNLTTLIFKQNHKFNYTRVISTSSYFFSNDTQNHIPWGSNHLLRMVMEAKYLAEKVIIHPNHHLTRWLDP